MITGDNLLENLITIFVSFAASSGFWAWIMQRRETNSMTRRLLFGLAHDKIAYLAQKYIKRGWITHEEHENLFCFLYQPYQDMGGNGSVKRLMVEVDRLPVKYIDLSELKELPNDC